jgi:hypothetical protein
VNKLYKEVRKEARVAGIKTASEELFHCYRTNNGATVAFRPAIGNSNCRMLEVAVSYCAPEDDFDPKVGKFLARRKLLTGEYIQLPLAQFLRDNGVEETREILLGMFQVQV